MTGEGKAAGTGRLGKIKLTFQIFPPCAMSGPPSLPPTTLVVWETNRLTREGVGDTVLVGSWEPPQAAAKSLLRARLFREVLCDLIQLGCALSVKLHCGERHLSLTLSLCYGD